MAVALMKDWWKNLVSLYEWQEDCQEDFLEKFQIIPNLKRVEKVKNANNNQFIPNKY